MIISYENLKVRRFYVAIFIAGACTTAQAADVKLRVMQTTDLHMHAMNFDYYQNKEVHDFGLARTATLIRGHGQKLKQSDI